VAEDNGGRVGRPEVPLNPADGPVTAFADALRALRRTAGNPTYAVLARRSGMSTSVLSEAARGRRLPTWPTVEAFVRACGDDPREWRERWAAASSSRQDAQAADAQAADAQTQDDEDENEVATPEPPTPRPRRLALAVGGLAVLVVAAAVVLIVRQSHAQPSSVGRVSVETSLATPSAAGGWVRVMGPGCGPNRYGEQVDVDKGWTSSGGGWTGDGCDGDSVTTPLFDSPTDWNRTVGWTFEPNFAASCQLEVYIPDSPDAAGAAIYQIFGKNPDGDPIAKSPPIPQQIYHGKWVSIGTYHFPDGIVTVELGNLGIGTDHIAADAVRATCH
jgi:transcriptional regulator with XRE-family HTH domain